ncbi:winged helix-turn-helix domain-containing protein [Shewanella sp. C32]|uniref:Winged helix-turn-helix domain-containing protein n=1 Tax=Shewanella electrica TaxID=515560 RepID=A0ABT2FNI6_9GAMM|nr:winged helix-turn-helix domain-containing protein [Shewanella electrica]MCH1926452.1 winged helix-turn-helix domain-containing protein [Shewanella electrica]MCS4557908.1 winged helix-turn-helix domain-containing protein [Shewanella electrica]
MNFLVVTDDDQWLNAVKPWIAAKAGAVEHDFALCSLNDDALSYPHTPDVVVLMSRRFAKPAEHHQLQPLEHVPFIYSSPASLDDDIAPVLVDETSRPFVNINLKRGLLAIGRKQLTLTDTELKIFRYLYSQQGQPVSKQELQHQILKREFGKFDRNLDMHVANIRKKLHQQGLPRTVILTVRGRGYSYNPQIIAALQGESHHQ